VSRPYLWQHDRRAELVFISPHLLIGALLVGCAKAVFLVMLTASAHPWWHGVKVLIGDLPFLSIFTIGLFFQGMRLHIACRCLIMLLLSLLLFWYTIDMCVIALFGMRLSIIDLITFARETIVLHHGLEASVLVIAYATAVGYSKRFRCTAYRSNLAALSLSFLVFSSIGLPNHTRYATSLELVRSNVIGGLSYGLTDHELFEFGATRSHFLPPEPPPEDAIVLVLIESFSSVDSARTSGIHDYFPRFDQISKQGRLFTNFIANHYVTEGGIASLFVGQPPMRYPGAALSFRHSMWDQDSVVRSLKGHGYHSIFISSASLDFRGKRDFLEKLGFDEAYGVNEVKRFRDAPKFTFGGTSDHVLYEESLERYIQARKEHKKVLFVIETTSSHEPYIDPLGRGDTVENVFDYVDSEFDWFFKQLKGRGLLNEALLVVTGDHRSRLPITVAERQRYGISAEARVPLLVYGQGFQPGVDARLFQQADLFRYLSRAKNTSSPLTETAIWVAPFSPPLFGSNPAPLRILTRDGGEYKMELRGRSYSWLGDSIPKNKRAVELELAQRVARLQYCNANMPVCPTPQNDDRLLL